MSRPVRILLALTHAALTAGALVLARQAERLPPPDLFDVLFPLATVVAILIFWWRRRGVDPGFRAGIVVGFQAAASLAAVCFIASFFLGLAKAAATGSVGWLFGVLLFVLTGLCLRILIAAVLGGFIASGLFYIVVRPLGRAGAYIGAILALAALALPTGAAGIQLTKEMGIVDFLTQQDEQHLFPVAVSIDLDVAGRSTKLDRVISCQRLLRRSDLALAGSHPDADSDYHWFPNLKSFGQVFPDGSGVFVIAPDICRNFAPPGQQSGRIVRSEGYLPLIGWTPDARALNSFDLYVDATALHRSDGRVHLRDVTIMLAPSGTPQSAPDAFARIGWQDPRTIGWQPPSTLPDYGAVYGIAVTQEQWQLDSAIASKLAGVEHTGFVLGDVPLEWASYPPPPLSWLFAPGLDIEVVRNGKGIPRGPVQGSGDYRWRGHILPAIVFPLRLQDGHWVARPDEIGTVAFYRASRVPRDIERKPELLSGLAMNGEQVSGTPSPFFYLPSRQVLVRLATASFSLAPTDGPFASR